MTGIGVNGPVRLRPDVILGAPLRQDGAVVHFLKDPRSGWYHRLGSREFFLVSRLDGRQTPQEIEAAYRDRFGRALTPAHWTSLVDLLRARRLLADDDAPATDAPPAAPTADAVRRRTARRLLHARFPLIRPDRFLAWCAPRSGALYSRWFVVAVLVASVAAAVPAVADASDLAAAAGATGGHPSALVVVAVTWLLLALHEAAHGLTCRRFGGTVTEMGLLWRFPLLTPYCKTDDLVLFPRRRHRVYTAFAGVFVNLVAVLGFTAAWWATPPGTRGHDLAGALLSYGWLSVAVNLAPVFRLDGYFMLNHALGRADLLGDTHRFVRCLLRRGDLGRYSRADRWLYGLYGLVVYGVAGAVAVALAGWWVRLLIGG